MLTRFHLDKTFFYNKIFAIVQFKIHKRVKPKEFHTNQTKSKNEIKQKTITDYSNICLNYNRNNNDIPNDTNVN